MLVAVETLKSLTPFEHFCFDRQVNRKTITDKRWTVRHKLIQNFAPRNFVRALTAIIWSANMHSGSRNFRDRLIKRVEERLTIVQIHTRPIRMQGDIYRTTG